MSTEVRPIHSPLGASGAERWMNCPGSVSLLKELTLPESDEPDYRADGSCAHEAAAHCLREGLDAWEIMGQKFYKDVEVTVEMADAIQVYLDTVRPLMTMTAVTMIEQPIQFKEHEKGYGTVDCATVLVYDSLLNVNDFKYGAGIAVDVENNPQLMYYAYGILQQHPDVRRVVLRIIQPRAFHPDGKVRRWETTAEDICMWANDVLIPAMNRTELDHDLDAGPWCRFCPAKLVCPLLTGLFGAAMQANPKEIVSISDASIGRSYQYTQAVKFYLKALEEETFRRLNTGVEIAGVKLVMKKANRVFKAEAKSIFEEKYGEKAYDPATLKSPAEMAKIDAAAAKLVAEWAYTPQSGLTVVLEDDKRPAVKVQTTQEVFAGANLDAGSAAE